LLDRGSIVPLLLQRSFERQLKDTMPGMLFPPECQSQNVDVGAISRALMPATIKRFRWAGEPLITIDAARYRSVL
jgi:hypothetical protein